MLIHIQNVDVVSLCLMKPIPCYSSNVSLPFFPSPLHPSISAVFLRSWKAFALVRSTITANGRCGGRRVHSLSQLVVMCEALVWCPPCPQRWPWTGRTTCIQKALSWTAACSLWPPLTWRYAMGFYLDLFRRFMHFQLTWVVFFSCRHVHVSVLCIQICLWKT